MHLKSNTMSSLVYISCLFILVSAKSENKFSFTFVIDNTSSMQNEIDGVKVATKRIFDAVVNTGSALIENYVLVTFNDPSVKKRVVTENAEELRNNLDAIKLENDGNYDCPEMALTGIELALKESLPHSLVYVFTDADVKDGYLLNKVKYLAAKKQIQLVFVLTNNCYYSYTRYDPTYTTLAEATNGLVFKGGKREVEKILNYAVESVKARRTVIASAKFPPGYDHKMNITVDESMHNFLVSTVGKKVNSTVFKPDGTPADVEPVVSTSDSKGVKVNVTEPGVYGLSLGSKSDTSVLVEASSTLDFYHGFSTTKPFSIAGTSILPLADIKSYLAIDVISDVDVKLESIELTNLRDKFIMEIPLMQDTNTFYVTESFKSPSGLFKIIVKGLFIKSNSRLRRTISTPIETQDIELVEKENKSPEITIDRGMVINAEYNEPLTIVCNVKAYPEPTITWYDDTGNVVGDTVVKVELPYDYKNILDIGNVNTNTTYKCQAKNDYGETTSIVKIVTKRKYYFDVLKRPEDVTIEYKNSGKVTCAFDSHPPSTITWERKDGSSLIDDNIEISTDGTELLVKQMIPKLVDTYSCKAENGVNSTSLNFKLFIGGVGASISIDEEKISVEYNEPINVKCYVNGFPEPHIVWKEIETGSVVPSITKTSEDKKYDYVSTLEIDHSTKNATYQCLAYNDSGPDSKNVAIETRVHIKVIEKPTDINIEFKKSGTVTCKVDANPFADITWYKNEVKLLSNDSMEVKDGTDGTSTLTIKDMRSFLNGSYTCKAENEFQTEEMNFNIFISGTAPITEIDGTPKINAEYESRLEILCKVSGYPEPEIVWHNKDNSKEIASSSAPVLSPYDYGSTLTIESVNKNTTCTCTARNSLGEHSTDIQIETVKKTFFNILVSPKDTMIDYKKSGKINCFVDSFPPSTITWYKEDQKVTIDDDVEIIDNGTVLYIKRMTPELNGTYSCKVQNGLNSTALYFNIFIQGVVPVVSIEGGPKQIVEYDAPMNLECKVTGFPEPKIIWNEFSSTITVPSTTVSSVDKLYDYVSILHIAHSKKNVTYECLASNDQGSVSKNIEVETRIHLDVIERPDDLNIQFRKDGFVKCKVDANPPAIIKWYKEGEKLRTDDYIDVMYGSDGSSMMTVTNMKPHIVGKYSCKATNDFQTEEMEFDIAITGTATITTIEGAPKIIAEYDEPISVLCKVSGYPDPAIVWLNKDTGKEILSALAPVDEPYDHGLLLQIDRVNKNETYTCKANNLLGEHSSDIQLETVRTTYFDILEQPKDTTIKYKENGQVTCNVSASPPANIIWYQRGIVLTNNSHFNIAEDRTTLNISNMQPDLTGRYACRARNNNNETILDFNINITGIVLPEIDKSSSDLTVLEGSRAIIECRVLKGDPDPILAWRYRTENEARYKALGEKSKEIIIENITRNQAGAYRCFATNSGGSDKKTTYLTVEYTPTIKRRNKNSITLSQGETKILYCDTSGMPKPNVTWLLNGTPVDSSEYEIFSDNSIKIQASVHNTGQFICSAKNMHGEANVTINVDYFVPVEIDPPKESKIEVLEGEDITMPCVADGHPQPKIQWMFFERNASAPKLLKDAVSPDTLFISSAQLERSGYYVCNAFNSKSSSNMSYEVIVNAPPRILEKESSKIFRAVKGDFILRLPCKATGWPKPVIRWIRNGFFLASETKWYDIADDGTLLIKNVDEGGTYFCNATNKYGSDEKSYEVQIEDSPTPLPPTSTVSVYDGDTVPIKCDIPHMPVDQLRWFKDGILLVEGELLLNKVDTSHPGLYTCRVSTFSGSNSSTVSVVIKY